MDPDIDEFNEDVEIPKDLDCPVWLFSRRVPCPLGWGESVVVFSIHNQSIMMSIYVPNENSFLKIPKRKGIQKIWTRPLSSFASFIVTFSCWILTLIEVRYGTSIARARCHSCP